MRMKASVPCSRGGCSTMSWSNGTPAGEATARASSGVTAAGLSRRSTTTISLPMPFILANAWLASALMMVSDSCPLYMANGGGLASVVNLCRSLSGPGESHDASVMGRTPRRHVRVRAFADLTRICQPRHDACYGHGEHFNEFAPLFPPCPDRAGHDERDRHRERAGAIAAAGGCSDDDRSGHA